METVARYYPKVADVQAAHERIREVILDTPLLKNHNLSESFQANIMLKREDMQPVRSYKLRGAYNKMRSMAPESLAHGVVCASAGNHAQGVAFSCKKLGLMGKIFMPSPTPKQKIAQVKMFGKDQVEIMLTGDTFDDAREEALQYAKQKGGAFIHPFDDEKVIEGQATIALEILRDAKCPIDVLLLPVGGGGLAAGVSSVFKTMSPNTQVIGVEPLGAPALHTSIQNGENTYLPKIDKFVDGAAVKQVGEKTFPICKANLSQVLTVHEGKVCSTIIQLYNQDAIVVEPAGALTVAALSQLGPTLKGKNIVCLISGSNNDITRTEEIRERALLYEGLKHYFVVRFPQRAGALKEFVAEVLGPEDDITHFEYTKRTSREKGPAVVGIELKKKDDLEPLIARMKSKNFFGEYLNEKPDLFLFLV